MKSCGDIRDAVVRGEPLSDEASKVHLAACEACAAIAENPAQLARALHADAVGQAEVAALLPSLSARIAEEKGARGWLASRPTWMRALIASSVSAAIVLAVLFAVPRPDLGEYPMPRMIAAVLAFASLTAGSLMLALRPAFQLSPGARAYYGVTMLSLAILVVLAMMTTKTAQPSAGAGDLVRGAFGCFSFGLILALPIYALVRMLDRRTHHLAAILAATGAGLTANLALHIHCPVADLLHVMIGHITVAAVLIAGAEIFRRG